MPNFHMHWLVALEAAKGFGREDEIAKGRAKYLQLCRDFRMNLYSALSKQELRSFPGVFQDLARDLERSLRAPPDYDSITCFSAYMLGACGPDFWTLMSNEAYPSASDTAGFHFDMGHYNRTHQQFVVSGKRLRTKPARTLTDRAERAYFAGMATHLATDLVIHELVNVYAGAYNILDHCWNNEHGATKVFAKLWSTHNKVEHFWDTYVRYRWLGDYGKVWSDADEPEDGPAPYGLPLADTLIREARKLGRGVESVGDLDDPALLTADDVMQDSTFVDAELAGPDAHVSEHHAAKAYFSNQYWENKYRSFTTSNTYLLERLITFPRIFCDRVLARDGIGPFIYDVVVRDGGAYPNADLGDGAIQKEKMTPQMEDALNGGRNEGNKLRTFSSRVNMGDGFSSFNFQTYFMCPRLERLRESGPTVFWEPKALPAFIETATEVAKQFAGAYTKFADDPSATGIGVLGNFWNLDTGLGVQVKNVRSRSSFETRTRIKLIHVTEATGTRVGLSRENAHAGGKKAAKYDLPGRYQYQPDAPAFDCEEGPIFPHSEDIHDQAPRYLRALRTEGEQGSVQRSMLIDAFFNRSGSPRPLARVEVPTNSIAKGTKVKVANQIAHRLSLELEASIVRLGERDETGFALYSDRKGNTAEPQKEEEHACEKWLAPALSQCLRLIEQGAPADARTEGGRARYTGRVLANFAPDPKVFTGRMTEVDEWNNFIDPKEVAKYCGRNFAVGTMRKNVLKQNGSGLFRPDKHFDLFTDLAPTEQVFFTIYPLLSTSAGCVDLFSGKRVSRGDFEQLRKIGCVGFVPIVLLYSEETRGYAQLSHCYIDGLEVPVEEVEDYQN